MSILSDDDPRPRPLTERRPNPAAVTATESLARWVEYAIVQFDEMTERMARAYLHAESAAKAADERMCDREDKSIGEFVSSEQLPNVHLEAMQAYASMAAAVAGSVQTVSMSMPIEIRS